MQLNDSLHDAAEQLQDFSVEIATSCQALGIKCEWFSKTL